MICCIWNPAFSDSSKAVGARQKTSFSHKKDSVVS